ncbi:MAG: GDP-mannose 4,6-dehydratase [Tannerellaceae bacterium]|nr:GDP-mannose 4,6-dehydratase [Tannerellaceae bacterium]
MRILITGVAGFIGFHLARRLLEETDCQVTGIDNLNSYYDTNLKTDRLNRLAHTPGYSNYEFQQADITDPEVLTRLFRKKRFDVVVHLAAQAGVRYSIEHPQAYVQANVEGFTNILECCRSYPVSHLLYASSSSVYGMSAEAPFSEEQPVTKPVSFYAATKVCNELMAHVYSHLYRLPVTGMRFFTVYGPWGRPDMAPFLFTKSILEGSPVNLFNHGHLLRDFTYVEDIVDCVMRLMDVPPDEHTESPFYQLFNIGNSHPVRLLDFIRIIEKETGCTALINRCPMQPGDVVQTSADTSRLKEKIGYQPTTSIENGLREFVHWFKSYYKQKSPYSYI